MKEEMILRIIQLDDGRWKFDVKSKMSDEQIRLLLTRLKYVEKRLADSMKTDILQVCDTIEFLKKRNLN